MLHPYFDDVMNQRLFVARFDDLGIVPHIALRPLLAADDPNFPALRFHMKNVVKRNSIMSYLINEWTNLIRRPSLVCRDLRKVPSSQEEITKVLLQELDCLDDIHRSKNNWKSVFVAGLLDEHVVEWLLNEFQRPGYRADGPLLDGLV